MCFYSPSVCLMKVNITQPLIYNLTGVVFFEVLKASQTSSTVMNHRYVFHDQHHRAFSADAWVIVFSSHIMTCYCISPLCLDL